MESTITSKGQANQGHPRASRVEAWRPAQILHASDGSVVVLPKRPASILRGIVKSRRPVTIQELDEAAAAGAAANALPRGR